MKYIIEVESEREIKEAFLIAIENVKKKIVLFGQTPEILLLTDALLRPIFRKMLLLEKNSLLIVGYLLFCHCKDG